MTGCRLCNVAALAATLLAALLVVTLAGSLPGKALYGWPWLAARGVSALVALLALRRVRNGPAPEDCFLPLAWCVPGPFGLLLGAAVSAILLWFARRSEAAPPARWLVTALLLVSLAPRVVQLDDTLAGPHEFRVTQTALATHDITERGFDPLHAQLPLFGPPWEVPMEYPVFQACAAGVHALAGWEGLDVSLRVANLVFFYLVAWLVFVAGSVLAGNAAAGIWALAAFLFSPFTVYWSRAPLIELAALFFAGAYGIAVVAYTRSGRRTTAAAAICAGTLAFLTKVTTTAVVALPVLLCATVFLVRRNWTRIGWTCAVFAVPPAIGYAWVRFSDGVKADSKYTEWLTSEALHSWNFASPGQRLDPEQWARVLERVVSWITTPWFAPLALLGALAICVSRSAHSRPGVERMLRIAVVFSAVLPVVLFFNLYAVHENYLIAVCAHLTLFVGFGLYRLSRWLGARITAGLAAGLMVAAGIGPARGYVASAFESEPSRRAEFLRSARAHVPVEHAIVVPYDDWSSFVPYYLRRRAFMLKPLFELEPVTGGFVKQPPFHWIVEPVRESAVPGVFELAWADRYEVCLDWTDAPYRLVRLWNAPLRFAAEQPLTLERITNATSKRNAAGALELRSSAPASSVLFRLDAQDLSGYDGVMVGVVAARPHEARVGVGRGRAEETVARIRAWLPSERLHRLLVPRAALQGARWLRFDLGTRPGEAFLIAQAALVRIAD